MNLQISLKNPPFTVFLFKISLQNESYPNNIFLKSLEVNVVLSFSLSELVQVFLPNLRCYRTSGEACRFLTQAGKPSFCPIYLAEGPEVGAPEKIGKITENAKLKKAIP